MTPETIQTLHYTNLCDFTPQSAADGCFTPSRRCVPPFVRATKLVSPIRGRRGGGGVGPQAGRRVKGTL